MLVRAEKGEVDDLERDLVLAGNRDRRRPAGSSTRWVAAN